MSILGEVWDEAVGAYNWLKSLTLGEFAEDRPTSVIVADMLLAMTVPGAVVVTSARDLAAVSLRLGRRYEGVSTGAQNAAHPEWQEWVILIASALGVFGPVICAAVGSLVGAIVGDEAAAVIRAVCLLLIERGGKVLEKVVGFLSRFTKGNIVKLLEKIHFAAYGDALLKKLMEFFQGMQALITKVKGLLSKVEYIGRARALLVELERMEKAFYAVQVNCAKEIPQALAKLDEALQKLLNDKLPPTYHPAYAGVPAPKAEVVKPPKVRVSSGIGEPPKQLPMKRDGVEGAGSAGGGKLPEPQEPVPGSSNVHRDDVAKMSRAEKGIFGEKVSDDFMTGRGYKSELSADRQMRLLEQQPTGRGIDGVYMNGKPPPPYVITETKFRTGGNFDADDLRRTRGSKGYPAAKQMSDDWIVPRLRQAVGEEKARAITKTDYERWLMVVDESGEVTGITKLDENAAALLGANGKPVTVPVK
ncbi:MULTISPECIES: hypothetical protein [unclassified Caballeronia]|uniref:hypothetical protein n=1 Tax=unclassified Caballeronia TaxID=2646786 RepID=UPI0028625E7B|nr:MULTISPECIES: hypothetical protein [unclassified Caballeronia]MDR5754497.1 hypothetical protein [Caballeronia sp. LZ024]MDR5840875.1 hypothetical protein [Caballeronia sp. LZ031]